MEYVRSEAEVLEAIRRALAAVKPRADAFKMRPMRCRCPGWCAWHTPLSDFPRRP